MCCENISHKYSPEEIEKISQRAKKWVISLEGQAAMEESIKMAYEHWEKIKSDEGAESSADIHEPYM